jgi:hypothetical protein
MSECYEIAYTLENGYFEWLETEHRATSIVAAFVYTDLQFPDEGMTFRDNVARALWRIVEPLKARADYTGESPLARSCSCVPKFGWLRAR